ncbi:MAG: DNA-binding response regulator [Desulfuromonas sp.]|nr:MAG: DNA-binding response regulator [Desulfuromonas sp.]
MSEPSKASPAKTIRVLFVEDHEVFHECMQHLLGQQPGMAMVGAARDGREALDKVAMLKPHVVVMDITMPRLNGIDATRLLRKSHPAVRVIALSNHATRQVVDGMLQAGAKGYVLKNEAFKELVLAIERVAAGESYLSPGLKGLEVAEDLHATVYTKLTRREREVLQLITGGANTKQIALELKISTKTVESHRVNLMKKLDVSNPVELALFALREGVSPLT